MGGVLHTINPRLFDDQLDYIVNHAEDRVLLYDRAFAPIVERMKPQLDDDRALHLLRRTSSIELATGSTRRRRLPLGRRRRARAVRPLLHQRHDGQSQGRALRASLDRAPRDGDHRARHLRPVGAVGDAARSCRCSTPTPGASPMRRPIDRVQAGHLSPTISPERLCRLFNDEKVTHSAGVPTVWLSMIDHIERTGRSARQAAAGHRSAARPRRRR